MRRQYTSIAIRLGIASVVAACSTSALAQQGQSGGELPPPTLDTPAPQTQPSTAPAATTAAPPTVATPAPNAAPAASAPASAAQTPPASSSDQPWYKRAWGSVTGWFSGDDGGEMSAPAAPPAPRPQAAAPAAPARGSVGQVEGYAVDSPERTIRTGVLGECVKTGTWREGMQVQECGGPAPEADAMARTEPTAVAAPMPEPMPEPEPEPVQNQPLPTPMEEPEAPLAVEPEPEPMPIPPPPAPRETMTLSADALFAVNSDVLKPSAKDSLAGMASKLADMEYESVTVVGHTDPTGSVALNERLSRRRAEAVKRHLIELGVPAEKISAQGVGSTIPVVDAQTCMSLPKGQRAACFQPDRRVDIEVTGTVSTMANQ